MRVLYLQSSYKHTPVNTPRQGKGITANVDLGSTRSTSRVPKPHSVVTTAGKLKLLDRVEQNLLHPMCVSVKLDLTSRFLAFRVPYADRLIGSPCGNLSSGGVPRDRAVSVFRSDWFVRRRNLC